MTSLRTTLSICAVVLACSLTASSVQAADALIAPASERFADPQTPDIADFQKHMVPLLGKLGCNGRACHGSFQGRGDFRLSLFGYDFKMDHEGLAKRIDTADPAASYAIHKPTLQEEHEGGKRMEIGSWEYNLFLNWVTNGAKGVVDEPAKLDRLEITPAEIQFTSTDQQQQLKAIAVWADGSREDVTCLCRFQSNDDSICNVSAGGLVGAGDVGDSHVVVSYDMAVVPVPVLRPVSDQYGDKYPQLAATTKVDELVMQKLSKLGLVPSAIAGDAEFLRRVHLDLTGTLPTSEEVRKFLSDDAPNKREAKINELLETPAYAAWWTTRLCDWTGCSEEQLNNVNPGRLGSPAGDWYSWIYKRVAANEPYDKIVEGIVLAQGRRPDESYIEYCERMSNYYRSENPSEAFAENDGLIYFWGRRNFQTAEDRAIGFAYTFMGTRIQCAQCHKHPFDVWTQQDFEQFEKFFASVKFDRGTGKEGKELLEKLEVGNLKGNDQRKRLGELLKEGATIPFPDIAVASARAASRKDAKDGKEQTTKGTHARLLGEQNVNLSETPDPRSALMDWLRGSPTKLFAKALVNRVWANYFNRGIVEPTDDLSLANPPSNQALLDHLADGFIANGYDMKWLHREICLSDTYQRTWRPNSTNAKDERNFSRAVPRRLPAEAAYDALVMASASTDDALKFENEVKNRALAIASPPRNNGNANGANYALRIFGRNIRESNCDCDRSMEASLLQTVYVRNDGDVLDLIDRKDGWVAEVALPTASPDQAKNERSLENLERKLADNRKQADNTDSDKRKQTLAAQADKLQAQIKELKARLARTEPAPMGDVALIEEAYLRTVSRFPTSDEQRIAEEFLAAATNHASGVRDLLWALMNTKEFMVNH